MDINAVYEVKPDFENCSSLVFRGESQDIDLIHGIIDGVYGAEEFPKFEVERSPCGFHVSDPNDLPLCDIASLSPGFLTLHSRAVDALSILLESFGSWIPLEYHGPEEASFKMFHTTFHINALDESKSEVKRFRTGRIYRFIRPVFHPEKLEGVPIFRHEGDRGVFVTNIFRDAVDSAGLTGFQFTQLWPPPNPNIEREKFLRKRQRKKERRRKQRPC